jgi:hypothetical protein
MNSAGLYKAVFFHVRLLFKVYLIILISFKLINNELIFNSLRTE